MTVWRAVCCCAACGTCNPVGEDGTYKFLEGTFKLRRAKSEARDVLFYIPGCGHSLSLALDELSKKEKWATFPGMDFVEEHMVLVQPNAAGSEVKKQFKRSPEARHDMLLGCSVETVWVCCNVAASCV